MYIPEDISLPFFAYGLFRPGQLAFFQLRELVSNVQPAQVPGKLLLRDGLPILVLSQGQGRIEGALLTFLPEKAADAYDRISEMEPDNHYRWKEEKIGGVSENFLICNST